MTSPRGLSTRFSRLERRVKDALFEQRLWDGFIEFMPALYARSHSTAVVAVSRYGNPQIDEPLCHAYRRTMDELESLFKTEIAQWLEENNCSRYQLRAGAVSPGIMILLNESEGKDARVAADLSSVPAWLLKFTGVKRDADILGYMLPDLSRAPKLGREARKDRDRWPLLPEGTIDAGGPCDEPDRQVTTEELLRRNTPWKFSS
jgi:hypothetical protein